MTFGGCDEGGRANVQYMVQPLLQTVVLYIYIFRWLLKEEEKA